MNLIKFIKSFLGKENFIGLINLNDILPKFKREEFSDTSKIDEFKSFYLKNLNQDRTLCLNDLSSDIKNKMEMYIDLFILNCPDEVNITQKNVLEEEAKNRVTSLKLKNYLKEVDSLILEIKYRLVALEEILSDLVTNHKILNFLYKNKYLVSNKVNCIKGSINILESNLISAENQAKALQLSLNSYERKYEFSYALIDKDRFQNPEKLIDEHLELKWEEVSKDLKVVSSLKNTITDSNCGLLSKIVFSEILLEKFMYENKNLIENYRDEINSIEKELNRTMKEAYRDDLNKEERERILGVNLEDKYIRKIEEIEKIYLLFQKYSRNIINSSDLEQLYKVNFWLMFHNVGFFDYITFDLKDEHPLKQSTYENIVLYIINDIMTDKNGFVFREFGMYTVDAIKWIDMYLKDRKKSYSIYGNILQNSEKMRVLLYVYFSLGIREYFEDYVILNNLRFQPLTNILFGNFIHNINLISYFKALHWIQLINKDITYPKSLTYFKKMFDLLEQVESDAGIYSLPDCITMIGYYDTREKETELIINDINSHAINKKVIFPNSLKRINVKSGFLKNIQVAGIQLNDGLEEIYNGSLAKVKIEYLSIPSSLRKLGDKAFDYESIKVLEFRDYTKSQLGDAGLHEVINLFLLHSKSLEGFDYVEGTTFFGGIIEATGYNDNTLPVHYIKNSKYVRSLDKSTNLEKMVFTDDELDEPIIIERDELSSIDILYGAEACTDYSLNIYPICEYTKQEEIIKLIEEKIREKRHMIEKNHTLRK